MGDQYEESRRSGASMGLRDCTGLTFVSIRGDVKGMAMRIRAIVIVVLAAAFGRSATAQEFALLRIRLDPLSLVSVGDTEFFSIPAGVLSIRAYPTEAEGILALRMQPGDFGTRSMTFGSARAVVELVRTAKGLANRKPDGRLAIELDAVFRVTYKTEDETTSGEIPLILTTESVEAWGADGIRELTVSGSRLGADRGIQLVGTASAGTWMQGAPVYVVLSGKVEPIPDL